MLFCERFRTYCADEWFYAGMQALMELMEPQDVKNNKYENLFFHFFFYQRTYRHITSIGKGFQAYGTLVRFFSTENNISLD